MAGEGHLSEAVVGTQQGLPRTTGPRGASELLQKGGRTIQYGKCGHTPIPTPEAWLRAQIYKQMLISVEKSMSRVSGEHLWCLLAVRALFRHRQVNSFMCMPEMPVYLLFSVGSPGSWAPISTPKGNLRIRVARFSK